MKKTAKQQNHFGARLRQYLDSQGIRYSWLCQKAQMTQMRMQRIFQGAEPTTPELQRMAVALSLTVDDLLEIQKLQAA